MRLTDLIESARHAGRYVVHADGAPFATVSADIIERLGLRVGMALTEPQADGVRQESAVLAAYDRAVGMLAVQARSSRDLRRVLVRKGEDAHAVDGAIERLVALGLLDDAAYARQLARSKMVGQGASRRRVQQEMFKRGIGREQAAEAIEATVADEALDEEAIVERVARRKVQSLAGLDPVSRNRRLWSFLARRGYAVDDIRRVVARVTAEQEPGD